MTTTQPAALPENELRALYQRHELATTGLVLSDFKRIVADVLAALQPQPAAAGVSDAEILHIVDTHVGEPTPRYPLKASDWINFARAILALRPQAVPMTWPKARDVGRFGDMHPMEHLRVGLDSDNDVYVSVWSEKGGASVEFCNPGGGGGGSSRRTREALIALMVAMEADNAERPDKDWWARRNGITAQGVQGEQA